MTSTINQFMLVALIFICGSQSAFAQEALPSWNEGPRKSALLKFVEDVTDKDSESYVRPGKRIAVFDNDGTLWAEQPAYFQLFYVIDRVKAMASDHPEWKTTEPFASILKGDKKAALAGGEKAILQLLMATHSGMTTEEFHRSVKNWLKTARHPQTGLPFNKMTYQPMVELLQYLRANKFKTFIVSAGGVDFMRVFAQEAYGIPPQQVVGSSLKAAYQADGGSPVIIKQPEINFIDDGAGKPVAIHQYLGHRPILAGGNSDGDFEMLEWTTSQTGPSLGLIVHHTDEVREYSYDRDSHIGGLERGLDEAEKRGWLMIDIKKDWSAIYTGNESP